MKKKISSIFLLSATMLAFSSAGYFNEVQAREIGQSKKLTPEQKQCVDKCETEHKEKKKKETTYERKKRCSKKCTKPVVRPAVPAIEVDAPAA